MLPEERTWGFYTHLRPDIVNTIRNTTPVAYVPWGSLEWHGPHLPIGTDGLIAEAIAERLAQRTGGVLFPATWWSASLLPHPESLSVRGVIVRSLWVDIFQGLAESGWKVVVVISGPYSQKHELLLMDTAEMAMRQHDLLVLALPPLAMVDETMLDHGGLWETSMLMGIRPNLVKLEALGRSVLEPAQSAVLGRDPRGTASASLGETAMNMAMERISRAVKRLLREGDPTPIYALYEQRRTRYNASKGQDDRASLEAAIMASWQEVHAVAET